MLWTGKPNRSVHFHSYDWYAIPFSLLWGGFAIAWEAGATNAGHAGKEVLWIFGLWGIPFVLAGQYAIWGRFFYTAWKKRRVVYAVTNRRLLTIVRSPQAKVISLYLQRLPGLSKTIMSSGVGTIAFGELPTIVSGFRGQKQPRPDNLFLNLDVPVFVDIDNAADVARLIETQVHENHAAQRPS